MAKVAAFDLSPLGVSLRSVEMGAKASSYIGHASFRTALITPSHTLRVQNRRCLKVSMAKREMLMQEIREMSDEEIKEKVIDLKGELFLMRCKKFTRQEYKVDVYQETKKKIARMLTVKREREVEKGIKPRESRKLKKAWKRSIVLRPPPSLVPVLEAQKKEREKAAKAEKKSD